MNLNEWDERARSTLQIGSERVQWHMGFMKEMVRIDSRSFNVNEFAGDRTTPTDMKEILQLAQEYLQDIGFPTIHINTPPPGPERSTPILMAEIVAGNSKPTLLMYAHLDNG
jgi:acetylornithine deacetylase/succinyl-diaminopimelate desuccinylase-like protein